MKLQPPRNKGKLLNPWSDLARTKKWAWETLIELVRCEPITPILKNTFILPALERKRKPPEENHGRGRTPDDAKNVKDSGRDLRIRNMGKHGFERRGLTVEKACEACGEKERNSPIDR